MSETKSNVEVVFQVSLDRFYFVNRTVSLHGFRDIFKSAKILIHTSMGNKMQPIIDGTLKALPLIQFGGLLVSGFITFTILQYRVAGLERRLDRASPETVVVELRNVQQRLNDIRDDIKELRSKDK